MADATPLIDFSAFSGLDDVSEQASLSPERTADNKGYIYPLHDAQNIIINNQMKIESRDGYTAVVAGTSPHSLWSDGDYCFFVENERLYRLNDDWSVTIVRANLAVGARMSYKKVNTKVYYTNGYQIGYIDLTDLSDHSLANPGVNFKFPLPPGQFIEHYRSRLYVASGGIVYVADPLADHYDNRRGAMQFPGTATMLRGLEEGVYFSSDKTYFLRGKGPDEFEVIESEYDAIPYTDVVIDGNYLGAKGSALMWMSSRGVCVGDESGKVTNITEKKHTFVESSRGAAIGRLIAGKEHYVAVLDYLDPATPTFIYINQLGEDTADTTAQLTGSAITGTIPADTDFSPSDLSDLVLWLKGDAITGVDPNEAVGTWVDSSTAGNNATQATEENKPLYKVNILNGKPVVRFDGSDDRMNLALITNSSAYSVFLVATNYETGAAQRAAISNGTLSGWGYNVRDGKREIFHRSVASIPDGSMTNSPEIISLFRAVTPLCTMFVNGASVALTNPASTMNAPATAALLGDSDTLATPWDGDIAEVIVYSSVLSEANRVKVENYLSTKYGIAVAH